MVNKENRTVLTNEVLATRLLIYILKSSHKFVKVVQLNFKMLLVGRTREVFQNRRADYFSVIFRPVMLYSERFKTKSKAHM